MGAGAVRRAVMTQVIGKPLPQFSAPEKVAGRAEYVGDMKLPGMLHVAVLRSPHAHARLRGIDTSAARRLRGVRAVVTGVEVPQHAWGPLVKEEHILAVDRVRFAGEEVAAVAATDADVAQEALQLINVEYEPLAAVLDVDAALRPGAPELHDGTGNVAREFTISRGDVDEAFRRSDVVCHEATYTVPYQYHAYMEPMGTVASTDGQGRLLIWAPTQSIYLTRRFLSDALGIPVSRIRVMQTTVGGAFGGKLSEDSNTAIAAFLALHTGSPVRFVNRRTDDFAAARLALPERIWLKMAMTRDGTISAKQAEILADNGAYSGLSPETVVVSALRTDNLHRLEHVRTHARLVYTNNIPSGTFRGFGTQQMQFAVDSHIAVLADRLGLDPVEVHLRNVVRPGDTTVHGWKIGSCGISECIEKAAAGIDWKAKRRRAPSADHRRRGVGIGTAVFVSGNRQLGDWDGSSISLKVNEDGRVNVLSGEGDLGQGATTVIRQIVAEELAMSPGDIVLASPDTDISPFCFGSFASRTTLLAGNAALKGARQLRDKLLNAAATLLETDPHDLELRAGSVQVKGDPAASLTVAEVCRQHLMRPGGEAISAAATHDAPTVMYDENFYGNVASAYSFAAGAAEVEVDVETGQITLLDYVTADDVGRALNPLAVDGQIHGAVTHGIGWTLYESLEFEDGRLVNPDFRDYTIPTATAVPTVRTILVESIDPNGPYGAKGAGETAIVPVAGAIASAVADAIGVRITSLPITPEKVLGALRAQDDA